MAPFDMYAKFDTHFGLALMPKPSATISCTSYEIYAKFDPTFDLTFVKGLHTAIGSPIVKSSLLTLAPLGTWAIFGKPYLAKLEGSSCTQILKHCTSLVEHSSSHLNALSHPNKVEQRKLTMASTKARNVLTLTHFAQPLQSFSTTLQNANFKF